MDLSELLSIDIYRCPACGGHVSYYAMVRCIECESCGWTGQSLRECRKMTPKEMYDSVYSWCRILHDNPGVAEHVGPQIREMFPQHIRRAAGRSFNQRHKLDTYRFMWSWRWKYQPDWLPF